MGGVRFRSPSTGRSIRAVLFDTFGTVVDWRTGIASAVAGYAERHSLTLDAAAFADRWRDRYQPSMEPIRSGAREFVTLDILHRENLDVALRELGVDPTEHDSGELDELSRAWHELTPWPDSVPGLTALRSDYIIGPLSNGNTSLLLDMAKNAGIPWDVIIGSDINRIYKPHPRAYLHTARLLGLDPGEVMLAAAHNDDLDAARAAGLATAFILRPLEHGSHQTSDLAPTGSWDISATDIPDLAAQLRAASRG
ncbi:haloacid dehalogenase type II [Rhodococcus opacus]|uniref:Putative epoxide hydrolase n=1 Tax=Rhodococcus opacus (strain B4) TaxID=632772 RepID=C1ARC6_RHOOB|nr:haloacid dehalogenase type II [Rhodococcus opacus]BAH48603.1 putative epoxide hydrolase [Rhodococcus opacus B4]